MILTFKTLGHTSHVAEKIKTDWMFEFKGSRPTELTVKMYVEFKVHVIYQWFKKSHRIKKSRQTDTESKSNII